MHIGGENSFEATILGVHNIYQSEDSHKGKSVVQSQLHSHWACGLGKLFVISELSLLTCKLALCTLQGLPEALN